MHFIPDSLGLLATSRGITSFRASFLVHAGSTAQTFSGDPAIKHLNGACEQIPTSGLMATQNLCILGDGVGSMAHKRGEHASTMLDCVETTGKATELVLVVPI